jgi:hypothetical protein
MTKSVLATRFVTTKQRYEMPDRPYRGNPEHIRKEDAGRPGNPSIFVTNCKFLANRLSRIARERRAGPARGWTAAPASAPGRTQPLGAAGRDPVRNEGGQVASSLACL